MQLLQGRSEDHPPESSRPRFPTQVRVYFKDFPLEPIHPWAKPAAIAGRCVFRQKPAAFWDFHDWIFEHQGEITVENLKDKVDGVGENEIAGAHSIGRLHGEQGDRSRSRPNRRPKEERSA